MATNPLRLTADDVLLVSVPDHLRGYELVDGRLVEVTPANPWHGRITLRIGHLLEHYLRTSDVGGRAYIDAGYVLDLPQDRERMRAPDVSFVTDANLAGHGGEPDHGFFRLVPDFAVEVDSPDRKPRVERQRIQDYLDAGVRLLWVIHPRSQSATVYRSDGSTRQVSAEEALEGEDVLPGFRIPLRDVLSP